MQSNKGVHFSFDFDFDHYDQGGGGGQRVEVVLLNGQNL